MFVSCDLLADPFYIHSFFFSMDNQQIEVPIRASPLKRLGQRSQRQREAVETKGRKKKLGRSHRKLSKYGSWEITPVFLSIGECVLAIII